MDKNSLQVEAAKLSSSLECLLFQIGLVEKEWLDTLATINPSEVTYTDFVTAGAMLANELKEKGCHFVIALTHMRTPNDERYVSNAATGAFSPYRLRRDGRKMHVQNFLI